MEYVNPVGAAGDPNDYGDDYRDKNAGAGLAGSFVPAAFPTNAQLEILNAIAKAGLTPSGADLAQLAKAIRSQKLNYFTPGGTANAITLAPDPAFANLAALVGVPLRFIVASANTAAVTLNVNGLGATDLEYPDGTPLFAGALAAGEIVEAIYDGTRFALRASLSPETLVPLLLSTPYIGFEGSAVSQSIATATLTRIASYTGIVNNLPGSSYSAGTLTIGTTGKYIVSANLNTLLPDVGGNYGASIAISKVDGSNNVIASIAALPIECLTTSPANTRSGAVTALSRLTAGDRIAAFFTHNRGSNLSIPISIDVEFRGA